MAEEHPGPVRTGIAAQHAVPFCLVVPRPGIGQRRGGDLEPQLVLWTADGTLGSERDVAARLQHACRSCTAAVAVHIAVGVRQHVLPLTRMLGPVHNPNKHVVGNAGFPP